MKPYPVRIVWDDAFDLGPGLWVNVDEQKLRRTRVVSVALLLRKTKRHVVIAHSQESDGETRGTFLIPRACVRSIRRLR